MFVCAQKKNKVILLKDDELKISNYAKVLETANLVEDIKFREITKSKEAVQEMLRTILEEEEFLELTR